MNASKKHLFELRLGVFATSEDLVALKAEAQAILSDELRAAIEPWTIDVDDADSPLLSDGTISVGAFYQELPEQWADERPTEPPGDRAVFVIRVGVYTDFRRVRQLQDCLTRAACEDLLHDGPCPAPWAADFTVADDEESRSYLEQQYGWLVPERVAS